MNAVEVKEITCQGINLVTSTTPYTVIHIYMWTCTFIWWMHTHTHALTHAHMHTHTHTHTHTRSSELLILHRYLYEELSLIQSLPESLQLDKFFSVLEKVSPSFSLYNCFTDSTRQQTLQVSDRWFLTCHPHPAINSFVLRVVILRRYDVQNLLLCVWTLLTIPAKSS